MDLQQAVLQNIMTRRSVRKYQERPIPHDVLERILEAGTWAPSASNRQTWHFTVVTDKKIIDAWNQAGKPVSYTHLYPTILAASGATQEIRRDYAMP